MYCLQIQVSPRQQLLLLRAQPFFNRVVENYTSLQMEKTIKGDFHGLRNTDAAFCQDQEKQKNKPGLGGREESIEVTVHIQTSPSQLMYCTRQPIHLISVHNRNAMKGFPRAEMKMVGTSELHHTTTAEDLHSRWDSDPSGKGQ